jgi:hypothetical protein
MIKMAGRFSLQTAQISCGDISEPVGRQMYVVYYSDVKLGTRNRRRESGLGAPVTD